MGRRHRYCRSDFHFIGFALHIQRAVSKSTKCSKFVGRSGPEVATGIVEVVQALFSRGQQLTGGTHADKLVYRGDRNRRSEKRCRLRATCSPLPPTRQLVAAPFPPSLPSRSADLSLPFRDTLRSCLAIVGLPGDARSGVRIAPRLQSSGPTHHTILAVCPVRPATPKERLAAQTRQQRPRPPNAAPRERAAHSRHSSRLAVPLDTRLGPASTEPCEHGVARHRRLLREWDEQAV